MENILDALKGKRIIICMDSNAKSPLWHSKTRDLKGIALEDFICSKNLICLNKPDQPFTFSIVNGESNIDVTIVNPEMLHLVSDWKVEMDWRTSDHRPLVTCLLDNNTKWCKNENVALRFNVNKADWELFHLYLCEGKDIISSRSNLPASRLAEELQDLVVNGASCGISEKKSKLVRTNKWWSDELENLRRQVRLARRRYQRLKSFSNGSGLGIGLEEIEEAKMDFSIKRNNYHRLIKDRKRETWRDFVYDVGNRDPWGLVYKFMTEKLSIQEAMSSINLDGKYSKNYEESLELLIRGLLPKEDVENYSETQRNLVLDNQLYSTDLLVGCFTCKELDIVMGNLKTGQAPGRDGVTNEILREVVAVIPELLLEVYNACLFQGSFPSVWKSGMIKFLLKSAGKPKDNVRSYRPICLLPVLGKLLERLIALKLEQCFGSTMLFHANQYGFVKGKSTTNAIQKVIRYVEESEHKLVAAVLFDVEGAFDSLWWPSVFKRLRERNCPMNLYRIIQDYLSGRSVCVTTVDSVNCYEVNKGCPQGSVLGAILWNINYDAILNSLDKIDCEFVAYADDLIVLNSAKSRKELETKLQIVVDTVVDAMEKLNLKISLNKTEAILLKGHLDSGRPPVIKMYNKSIKFVKECKYLGVYLDNGLSFLPHVKVQRTKLVSLAGKILRVATGEWGLNMRTLKILYKGVYLPILTYGAACWFGRVKNTALKRVLISSQRPFLLMVTRACRTVSNDALHVLSGFLPADLQVVKNALMYFNKMNLLVGWETILLKPIEIGTITLKQKQEHIKERERNIIQAVEERWQERWNTSDKGRVTYQFLRNVGALEQLRWVRLDYKITSFMSGHGFFKQKLNELGLEENGKCECGKEQTAIHLLLDCVLTQNARRKCLGNRVLNDVGWFLGNKERFIEFKELVEEIFALHEQGIL